MSPLARHLMRMAAVLLFLVPAMAPVLAAGTQQTLTLRPGWNAVFLEIEPDQRDLATIFAGIPIASIWRWRPDIQGAQFVRDPAEGLENIDGWFAWFPEPRPDAFLSNLFQLEGNTAYLIRLDGNQQRQVTLSGRPLFRPTAWVSNAFTLTGLPASTQHPPTFAEYFGPSTAHSGQPVYTLDAQGRWQLVSSPGSQTIERGRAYWIFTRGSSRYQGPMQVVLDQGDALEFSAALDEIRLVLRNFSGASGSFLIERINGETLPLLYLLEDEETGELAWPELRDALMLDAPAGSDVFFTLAVDRRRFTSSRMEQVFSITDEQGTRVLLYAGGSTIQPFAETALRNPDGSPLRAEQAEGSFAGLWVGNVIVDKVSEAQQAGTTPTGTSREFQQRVLVHVDGAGQARLLKDVIQMWEEGTYRPSTVNPQFNEVDQPGRHVLLTNKNLIGLYTGAATRDGTSVGIRFSTVAYDFAGDSLSLNGEFGPDKTLQGTLVLEPQHPTNPFLHRYHPDHNNLDEQFLNYREEAYRVVRDMQFVFAVEDPSPVESSGWGSSRVGGTFRESIIGLHRNPIFVSGRFELRRVSAVAVLNQ
jgi:hypothetical protein